MTALESPSKPGGALVEGAGVTRLGPLESQVMNTLWDHGEQTVRQVISHLPSKPAYTTIATVLKNLERKELVTADRDLVRRRTRYSACVECYDIIASQMMQVLSLSRDRSSSLQKFVEMISDEDLRSLRSLVDLERR